MLNSSVTPGLLQCIFSISHLLLRIGARIAYFRLTNQVTCRGTFRDHFPVDQVPAATSLLLICPPRGSFNKLTLSPSLRLLRKLSSLTIANSGVSYSNICWMRAMIDSGGVEKIVHLSLSHFVKKSSGSQYWAANSVGPFLPSKLEPHLQQHLPHRRQQLRRPRISEAAGA